MITMNEAIKILVEEGRSELERGDKIIKDMCRLTNDILDYRYVVSHYGSDNEMIQKERKATIKNALAILMGDLQVYVDTLGVRQATEDKMKDRLIKLAEKNISK